jgi:hypothetical protein
MKDLIGVLDRIVWGYGLGTIIGQVANFLWRRR